MIGKARHSELIAHGNDANSALCAIEIHGGGRTLRTVRRVVFIRRDYQDGGPIMKKLGMLGIIGGAAILTAVPLSLQWSQKNVVLSLDSAKAGTATSAAGVNRRVHRRAYRRAAYASAVAGVGANGYGSYYRSLADCGYYLRYGTSYVAPCGIYSSSYAAAYERLQAATATPYGYSYDAPYSYYGPSSHYRRPSGIFY